MINAVLLIGGKQKGSKRMLKSMTEIGTRGTSSVKEEVVHLRWVESKQKFLVVQKPFKPEAQDGDLLCSTVTVVNTIALCT
jgi:hypothetical protein